MFEALGTSLIHYNIYNRGIQRCRGAWCRWSQNRRKGTRKQGGVC